MFLFHPKKATSFLKEAFEVLAVWALVVKGAEFLWTRFGIASPELTWAYTVATGMAALYLFMFICFSRQLVYQNRIDEMAASKKALEDAILKKRLSSKKSK